MLPKAEMPVVNQPGDSDACVGAEVNGGENDDCRDEAAQEADTAAADHVGHPHLLGVTGFGDLVCPAVDEYIECVVDVPHRAADNAADTCAGEGQTDESRRVTCTDGALEGYRHCSADVGRVGQIPCDCAAGE